MYLDNSATTQVSEEVFKEMEPYFIEEFGNPSTLYGIGRESKKALTLARQRVADSINAKPEEIIFTSGYGSANTREKRNGFNGAFDSANSTLKMAQKRALVSAAISICGGSDLFTQDIEDETGH